MVTIPFMFNTLPAFFLNIENKEFEAGIWRDVWPPLGGVGKAIMNRAVPMWHAGRWRFASCDGDFQAKRLAA